MLIKNQNTYIIPIHIHAIIILYTYIFNMYVHAH